MKDRLYVVIPAYNEEENIRELIDSWYPVVETVGSDSKLVIVNDGSRDHTYDIMLECAEGKARLVPLTKSNGGHGDAVLYGYRYAVNALNLNGGGIYSKPIPTVRLFLPSSGNFGTTASGMMPL